jgi:hypothetical protein
MEASMASFKSALLLSAAVTTLFTGSVFAKTKIETCSLFVNDPVITHDQYGSNTSRNSVNSAVLRTLQKNGFSISTVESSAKFTMKTEVRCGKMWSLFGFVDSCQTEVTFIDNLHDKLVYSNGPTVAAPGLNINYDAISFPECKDL